MLPTPAVALLALDLGVVISASHNPPEYNGVKFFDEHGSKLTDASEEEIEALLDAPARGGGTIDRVDVYTESHRPRARALRHRPRRAADRGRLRQRCPQAIAPAAFERLGAEVTAIGDYAGRREHQHGLRRHRPQVLLQRTVREGGHDLGIAFDGDGDRMLAVDGEGNAVDGDQILASSRSTSASRSSR